MNNEKTEEQENGIELSHREVDVLIMCNDQTKKYFSMLEKFFEKYLIDHKKQEVPLAIIIGAFSEVNRGMDDAVVLKRKAAEKKIQDILDGKDTDERIVLKGEDLYPDMESLTKGEEKVEYVPEHLRDHGSDEMVERRNPND